MSRQWVNWVNTAVRCLCMHFISHHAIPIDKNYNPMLFQGFVNRPFFPGFFTELTQGEVGPGGGGNSHSGGDAYVRLLRPSFLASPSPKDPINYIFIISPKTPYFFTIFFLFALTECPWVQKSQPYTYIHFIVKCPLG